jgi:hypothetical protein
MHPESISALRGATWWAFLSTSKPQRSSSKNFKIPRASSEWREGIPSEQQRREQEDWLSSFYNSKLTTTLYKDNCF